MSLRARFRLAYAAFSLEVDLELPGKGVTALFGVSGSGKTTLLRCIAGLERRAQGFLEVNGERWQDHRGAVPTHRRALGFVFQDARLFPHLSVAANLDFGRRRVPAGEQRVSLEHAIELLGIEHLLSRRPQRLSGGERQRVAIARALATSPRLLLMDEPLVALDLARKQEVLPYLERLRDDLAIPLIYVTHAPDEVARLADYLVVMESGRAVAQGPLAETLARLDLPIRLGDDAGVVLDSTVVERDATWQLARVAFAGGSLWVRDAGHDLGRHVRVRVQARDVSIARQPVVATSILNTLPARVVDLAADAHPALMLVLVHVGEAPIVARVTRRSVADLGLEPGQSVWIQIKTVALVG